MTERPTAPVDALVNIAIEGWRFARVYARVVSRLEAHDQPRYASQHRYFLKQLEQNLEAAGLKLVAFDEHPYDPGLPLAVLNLDDFSPGAELVVDQTMEPVVMGPAGVVRMGAATVKRA